MKAEKTKTAELPLCYCVTGLLVDGQRCFAVASEKEYACLLFNEHGELIDKIWDEPGGTMSAVQLPGEDAAFLATHRFFSPNNCKQASIILCHRVNGRWIVRTLAELPGVHRFDILSRNGKHYLLACTIKSDYDEKDDWRFPGKVYACPLPENLLSQPENYRLPLQVLKEPLVKNHGYSRDICEGISTGIVTSEEGVFRFTPPASPDAPWAAEQLLVGPTSDALLLDFDEDGEKELLTLSPFHGDTLRVYKKNGTQFFKVFESQKKMPFLHAICPAVLNGKPLAILGNRREGRDLMALSWDRGDWQLTVLDHNVGPTNVLSFGLDDRTMILSANREINEIAFYALKEDSEAP